MYAIAPIKNIELHSSTVFCEKKNDFFQRKFTLAMIVITSYPFFGVMGNNERSYESRCCANRIDYSVSKDFAFYFHISATLNKNEILVEQYASTSKTA